MQEAFGAQLRRLRQAAAFTQEALAERAGLSPAAIAALENGRRTAPRLTTVSRLADALHLDASERASLAQAAQPDGAEPEPDAAARPAPRSDPSEKLGAARHDFRRTGERAPCVAERGRTRHKKRRR
jgi:transcriptional regulator with XRE-family HTH domain